MKLEKIPFKNGNEPSISEETLEQLQENIDKAINTHPIIKMQIDRQNLVTSGSYGEAKIPLNVKSLEIDNEKDYLLVGNNEIIIGENVNLVEITAHTRGISYYETKGDKEFKLMHNSSNIGGFFQKEWYWLLGSRSNNKDSCK